MSGQKAQQYGLAVVASVAQYKCGQRRRLSASAFMSVDNAQRWARTVANNLLDGNLWLFLWEAALVVAEASAPASDDYASMPGDLWAKAWAVALQHEEVRETLEAFVLMNVNRASREVVKAPGARLAAVHAAYSDGRKVLTLAEHPRDTRYTTFVASLVRQWPE